MQPVNNGALALERQVDQSMKIESHRPWSATRRLRARFHGRALGVMPGEAAVENANCHVTANGAKIERRLFFEVRDRRREEGLFEGLSKARGSFLNTKTTLEVIFPSPRLREHRHVVRALQPECPPQ